MNINYIEYSIATKSLDIFVAGCNKPLCRECCNPELADFNNGTYWKEFMPKITGYINSYNNLIENIFLLGGSFNHQKDEELEQMIPILYYFNKPIWLFQREDLIDAKPIFKKYCTYIKCGEFIPELKCGDNIQYNINLATSNQNIYKKGVDFI